MTKIESFGKITEPPTMTTNAERCKRYREKNGPDNYLTRPFIAWDGEGVTLSDGSHRYTLLASSAHSTLQDDDGLRTQTIFDCLIRSKLDNADGINVIYGGSYDFNMWLTDLSYDHLNRLYETGSVLWRKYRIVWRRGKSLRITDRDANNGDGISITVYDVVSFFQCPFVQACDDYLGDRFIARDMIVANKAARGKFTTADNETVADYNQAELDNLVLLMQELRLRLHKVNLRPSRWDGPGAIASALLGRERIKDSMSAAVPDDVARAGRFGYFGGRFEVIRCGNVHDIAYEYDINSAYPSALRNVPNLSAGTWIETTQPPESDKTFGIYEITWEFDDDNAWLPQPFPIRAPNGLVMFNVFAHGYYWAPEIVAAQEYAAKYGGKLSIIRGWRFDEDNPDDKPFAFVAPMYLKRMALKKAKDGAHVGIKLGLNSLYGKTCQRVGWSVRKTGQLRIPPFHQLEWAGYVTSHCRSLVLRAALQDLQSVIAFETDALFTSRPLDLPIGPHLGEWEETRFTHLCYLQSGFYFGTVVEKDGTATPFSKTRGVDRGSLTFAEVENALMNPDETGQVARAQLTRFIGIGLARQFNDWSRWCRWETTPKEIKLTPQGKRAHDAAFCPACQDGAIGLDSETWHNTYTPWTYTESCEYPIPWINPDPNMTDIEEFTELHREEMSADYE